MCCLVALLIIGLVLCQNSFAQLLDEQCGEVLPFKITGGYVPKHMPFMAALYHNTEFMCGGSLIHKRYVLTAGHCVMDFNEVTVHLGEYNRSCPITECNFVVQLKAEVVRYPRSFINVYLADIALLRLEREVAFQAHIRPICISLDEEVTSDSENSFTAYGWGSTDPTIYEPSDILKAVSLKRLDQCNVSRDTICAGGNMGDTCRADSGGPLVGKFKYLGKTRHLQFGIVSYGNRECDGSYGIYTDVNAYKSWIANVVLENEPRILQEKCKSDWGGKVLVRLWEMSLITHKFAGALITNQLVLTAASAFPDTDFNATEIEVESVYQQIHRVGWVKKHPDFSRSPSIRNNIAVIRLAQRIPKSDLEIPICLGLNLSPPTAWSAYLYSAKFQFLGSRDVNLKRIPECSVESDQICVEKPNPLAYQRYETPGLVIGTNQMFKGRERYMIAGIVSHTQDNAIVFTNIQDHAKWIADQLIYT
ncbi:ovochymase-2 [Drosophila teissieri]|uniref:ovochymase-2 n=1 Tax=Drosophila teissieri TaxID=7243 RepID=UPI001CBA095C|nr:ovochymase-2 [Drosophila teissieri]